MKQNLDLTIALLARTPVVLDALLRDMPEAWSLCNEGEKTWNAFDIVGHLIQGEREDWLVRTRMVLECGESAVFEPFDREGHVRATQGKPLTELLDEFARLRAENLSALRGIGLGDEDLERRGRHPVFGTVTLSELLATWAVHDLTHLHQISRVMAVQYKDAVGPWSTYLGVLHCAGHGS